jgi:hypothetical protein
VAQVQALELLPAARKLGEGTPATLAAYWLLCLFSLVGSTAPAAGLLALAALGVGRRGVGAAAAALALAFAGLAWLPRPPLFEARSFFPRLAALFPEIFLFAPLGIVTLACVGVLALRGLRRASGPDRLLALWLAAELAGYFVVAPYPAVRRTVGLGLALALLAARGVTLRGAEALAGARSALAFALLLAAIFFGSELADARARRGLVERADAELARLGANPVGERVWYFGFWELAYYGERAGWHAVIANVSHLRAGDWLVLPEGVAQPALRLRSDRFRARGEPLVATSASPWTTIPFAYDGPVPLRRQAEQTAARLYRVTGEVVAAPPKRRE